MSAQIKADKKPASSINLLPEKGFSSTPTGRVLAWILSTFRIIVIITEIIVMIAFLSRFWLDAKNSDLTEEIDQKKAILTNFLPFEKEFKDVQGRIKIYNSYLGERVEFTNYLSTIKSYLPNDVVLTSISFTEGVIAIDGYSPSEVSIEQFQVNLISTNLFPGLSPQSIKTSLKVPGSLEFSLTADLKGGKS